MRILDATCGFKGIWFQKNHPFVTFMDKRKGKINTMNDGNNINKNQVFNIKPDVVSEWKDAPFPNNYFDMIIFDPPHIIRKKDRKIGWIEKKYGYFYEDTWKHELKIGIEKLFYVLKPNGVFILKWCDVNKQLSELLKLFPYKPLFGTVNNHKTTEHWVCFIKYDVNLKLDEYNI